MRQVVDKSLFRHPSGHAHVVASVRFSLVCCSAICHIVPAQEALLAFKEVCVTSPFKKLQHMQFLENVLLSWDKSGCKSLQNFEYNISGLRGLSSLQLVKAVAFELDANRACGKLGKI